MASKQDENDSSVDPVVSGTRSPPPVSGLEMLHARSRLHKVDAAALLDYIRADKWTWARWNEVSELQVAEALALHHHLDPERLGIRRAADPIFQLACKHLGGQGQPLWEFFVQLVWLPAYRFGLHFVKLDPENVLGSTVEASEFARSVGLTPNAHLAGLTTVRRSPQGDRLCWPCEHVTSHVRMLFDAAELWKTPGEGGSYVPGNVRTAPDVAGHLLSKKQMSARLCRAIATILRPEDLPKGRPPTRR